MLVSLNSSLNSLNKEQESSNNCVKTSKTSLSLRLHKKLPNYVLLIYKSRYILGKTNQTKKIHEMTKICSVGNIVYFPKQ